MVSYLVCTSRRVFHSTTLPPQPFSSTLRPLISVQSAETSPSPAQADAPSVSAQHMLLSCMACMYRGWWRPITLTDSVTWAAACRSPDLLLRHHTGGKNRAADLCRQLPSHSIRFRYSPTHCKLNRAPPYIWRQTVSQAAHGDRF